MMDLSNNPNITMYGKVHLFTNMFDVKFDKHELKVFHIDVDLQPSFFSGLLTYTKENINKFWKNLVYRTKLTTQMSAYASVNSSFPFVQFAFNLNANGFN